ncbi:hypothetical protein PUMCH_002837 [Australozyma saopauloensis]|uniref:DNA repair and recombination protein RDH54 n=1 Tax=Australozyma saopauloensis TaxID=291208 RepID=A0AAX4HAG5_9ASCO|nr:hypothetical protein PUMCH_002837 [[Candida] saopauloensis]
MYRKPNAPFRPPRPIGSRESGSNNLNSETSANPDVIASGNRVLPTPTTENTNTSFPVQARVKRLKVGLVRRPAPVAPAADLAEHESRPSSQQDTSQGLKKYYTVQWRKRTNKKNKSWEGDGYIVVTDEGSVLKILVKDRLYKPVGRSKKNTVEGLILFGSYEAEVDSEASLDEIRRLTSPDDALALTSSPVRENKSLFSEPMKKHNPHLIKGQESLLFVEPDSVEPVLEPIKESPVSMSVPPAADLCQFSLPMIGSTMKRLNVDECLLAKLREHQREAVLFIYECIVGIRDPNHLGALLADEMGLGKTLTAITVIWTLLKQSPIPNEKPPLKKVLICCPVTLIDNWYREFTKWLDINRIGILALNKQQTAKKDKQDIVSFGKTKVYQVLIMSYEKVMSCSQELSSVDIDLMVCDEGHRLKSAANKTLNTLTSFQIPRKLLLTGTPIQNDLNEYYTIINFINPGILGLYPEFQKNYLRPIVKARDKSCLHKDTLREGKSKSNELIAITKSFVLRRTKDSIRNFLTDRTDVLVFCRPNSLQKRLFELASSSNKFTSVMGSESTTVLSLINVFRKICNLPSLVVDDTLFQQLYMNAQSKPELLNPLNLKNKVAGSKINVLVPLLLEFKKNSEKVVLISNFTQTLDLLELVLSKLNMLFLRLDGTTSSNTRDQLVTKFNTSPLFDVFLLSAKAGGVGLNLIGASRLILFDNDWNPLIDQQALARIHRDGQKLPVFVYRLFTAGAIDEKIFQRQLTKITLSDQFLDEHTDSNLNIFDYEDLRDLFTINDSKCNTHDLLECECKGDGSSTAAQTEVETDTDSDEENGPEMPSSGFSSALSLMEGADTKELTKTRAIRTALVHFKHYDPAVGTAQIEDQLLARLLSRTDGDISYCFTHLQASGTK